MANANINHLIGLDLGQTHDPSALCILERREVHLQPVTYQGRGLKRWPLGTTYPEIVEDVLTIASKPELIDPVLVVDQTGVGRAVVDLFRYAEVPCAFAPVTITGGMNASQSDGEYHVPKKDIVGGLQVLLGHSRIKFAPSPLRELLIKELQNFKMKITLSLNEVFGAWREGEFDDLVLSVGIAVWIGEHACITGKWSDQGGRSNQTVMSRAPRDILFRPDADADGKPIRGEIGDDEGPEPWDDTPGMSWGSYE